MPTTPGWSWFWIRMVGPSGIASSMKSSMRTMRGWLPWKSAPATSRSTVPRTRVVMALAKSIGRLDFDSTTRMPRACATTGAFTMFTWSLTVSSRPFSTAIVIGATRSSATSPAYSTSTSSSAPALICAWKRPIFSASSR